MIACKFVFVFGEGPCSDPGSVEHATQQTDAAQPYQSGDQVIINCSYGYAGGGVITCLGDNQWTEKPTCTSGTCVCWVPAACLTIGTVSKYVFRRAATATSVIQIDLPSGHLLLVLKCKFGHFGHWQLRHHM